MGIPAGAFISAKHTIPDFVEYHCKIVDPFQSLLGILQPIVLRIKISHSTCIETLGCVLQMESIPEFSGNSGMD